jgi:hypothetical protein
LDSTACVLYCRQTIQFNVKGAEKPPAIERGNKMTTAEQKARKLIASRSTENLIKDFELTETNNDPYIPTVRGWIMDELEKRDAEAFEKWIDSDDASPRNFYLN